MRKHSLRKWLHAVLDLLPLVIIPIFAVYSHRHTIDNYSVTVSENKIVDFNQKFNQDYSNFLNYHVTSTIQSDNVNILVNDQLQDFPRLYTNFSYIAGHQYYFSVVASSTTNSNMVFGTNFNSYALSNVFTKFSKISTIDYNTVQTFVGFSISSPVDNDIIFKDLMIIDLSQMFGVGNEPTLEQFNNWYSSDYYSYTLSHKELLKDYSSITYNDTDIGSQFVYALYRPIDKYFNLSQVGVFGQLYDFLQVNMFNGNAPLSIFIVYHVILYEFIMDLIFLLYSVFMFIIDFAERLIDSFFDKSFGGGR